MPTESPGGSSFENDADRVQFRVLKASKNANSRKTSY